MEKDMGLSKAEPVCTVIECDSQGNPTIRWAKAPKVGDSFYSAPSIPEGWQLVPKDPTPEMTAAASEQADYDHRRGAPTLASNLYRAMLSASPQPGEGKP